MSDADIRRHLQEVSGWHHVGTAIEKTFTFINFYETMAFLNAMAWICHTEDHHPEVLLTYNRCVVRFSTHTVNGVSINDFICAAKVNALVAFVA
jgi:4a-hydroxytetrahydrobiopterin dehydratase